MSVIYKLNIPVKIKDLKDNGFKITNLENDKESIFIFLVEDEEYNSTLGVIKLYSEINEPTEDDLIITELKGKPSTEGGICLLKICDKLNRKFITDEDVDKLIYINKDNNEENEINIPNEMFEYRTNEFKKLYKTYKKKSYKKGNDIPVDTRIV